MAHVKVAAAEKLLDQHVQVLDRGFVRLVDYLGGDARIVQAARVSYGAGTRSAREDKGLINYLMRNQHTSPFEQVVLTLHCKLPIFVARQWIRHRTARVNELSGRYSVMRDEFYLPARERVQTQSEGNRQGSGEAVPPQLREHVLKLLEWEQAGIYGNYEELIGKGIARELARINLPLSLYTEWYWQIDLHNLFNFLKLRLDPHAQLEIRQYAKVLARCAKAVAPLAYGAFEEYVLFGARLSRRELKVLRKMLGRGARWGPESDLSGVTKMSERMQREFAAKIWDVPAVDATGEIKPVDRGVPEEG